MHSFLGNDALTHAYSERNYQLASVNVLENDENFSIEVALPGVKKEDIQVKIQDGLLTVSTEKEQNKEKDTKTFLRREFTYQSFYRSFELPEILDQDAIAADFKNGVLHLTLPKREEAKKNSFKQITVQ